MGGIFRVVSSVFKPIARAVSGGKKKKKAVQPIVRPIQKAVRDVAEPARRVAALGSGYAGSTIMTTASGIEEKARSARTLLGS